MTSIMGVAISTTGDEHRIPLLRQCVQGWRRALPLGSVIVVTVDGTEADAQRARAAVDDSESGRVGGNTYRVGQREITYHVGQREFAAPMQDRLGVAVNKNTGLELLMDSGVEHLFLCDDDTWPLHPQSLAKHIDLGIPHSMVCWGKHRLNAFSQGKFAYWDWPRGVMLYQTRAVVEQVGGMDERFGPGGHEHVEWSQRIHNAGLTPAPFVSPASYATRDAMGAAALWHAEDMPRRGESRHGFARRRHAHTSVRTTFEDWKHIDQIMAERQGSDAFVPFLARDNGRASATLCTAPSRGAAVIERDEK